MTDFPALKIKALVSFPATAIGGTAIAIEKTNGSFVVNLAYDDFAPSAGNVPDPTNQTVLLWNSASGQYALAPISLLGGGVAEAPLDGTLYGRQNAGWVAVPTGGGGGGGGEGGAPGIRLSLVANTAITSADAGGPLVYGVPIGSAVISIYDGTSFVPRSFSNDRQLILDSSGHPANTEFSVFAYWNGSAVALGSGPAWISDTNPGMGAGTSETEYFFGRDVNKFSITLRGNGVNTVVAARQAVLVGGFGTTLAGQTEDSIKKRLLSNVYNAAPRPYKRWEDTDQWNGDATGLWRQSNGSGNPNSQFEFFSINGAYPVSCVVNALVTNNTATGRTAMTGIGLDTNTAVYLTSLHDNVAVDNARGYPMKAFFNDMVPRGRHTLYWLELSGATDIRIWFGDGGNDTAWQTGMTGTVHN